MTRLIDADTLKKEFIDEEWGTNSAVVKIIDAQPTVQVDSSGFQWIPASEKLPDRIGRYLVYSTTIPMWEHFILNYDPEYKQWFWDGFRSEDCDINVLAWMPLPRHYEANHEQTD